jgi:hypothetical protein
MKMIRLPNNPHHSAGALHFSVCTKSPACHSDITLKRLEITRQGVHTDTDIMQQATQEMNIVINRETDRKTNHASRNQKRRRSAIPEQSAVGSTKTTTKGKH